MSTPVTGPLADYPGLNSPAVQTPAPPQQGLETWQLVLLIITIIICVFIMAYVAHMGGVF
jgi:hypothetical protein